MSKNLKRVYLTLAIALLIGMGLYTYLNHIPKAEAFGYESMVFCILGYLAYRPFSKQDEFRVIVFTFLTMALLRGTALLPQFSFNNWFVALGIQAIGRDAAYCRKVAGVSPSFCTSTNLACSCLKAMADPRTT